MYVCMCICVCVHERISKSICPVLTNFLRMLPMAVGEQTTDYSEVSLRTGLAPVSERITRGRNAIFGHVARLPDNIPAHQAMLRQVELSVGRPQTLHGNVHQVDHVPNGPTNSAAIPTMFPLRLCGGKLLVAVTRERRYGPSRLRVNDDDDDEQKKNVFRFYA